MAFNNSNGNGSSNASNNNNNNNGGGGEESDGTKKKNLIIVVEEGSQDKLDELFDQTLKNKIPLQRPLKMRKLPYSFFNPPSSGSKSPSVSHSRENSADSAFGSGTTVGAAAVNGLQIHHSRAHSSPASLGKINLGGLGMPPSAPCGGPNINGAGSNNNNHLTTSKVNVNSTGLNTNFSSASIQSKGFLHSRGRSYDHTNLYQHQYGELPPGWEQAKTSDGRIYYIKYVNLFSYIAQLVLLTTTFVLAIMRKQRNGKTLEMPCQPINLNCLILNLQSNQFLIQLFLHLIIRPLKMVNL